MDQGKVNEPLENSDEKAISFASVHRKSEIRYSFWRISRSTTAEVMQQPIFSKGPNEHDFQLYGSITGN